LDQAEAIPTESAIDQTEPVGLPSADLKTHDRSLVRSIAWSASSDWVTQIFSWLSLLIVMRLLTPADFGIAALAVLLMPYLKRIADFGISRAVVNLPDLTDDQLAQLNAVNLAAGASLFLLVALFAKPFAAFLNSPRIVPVTIVACSSLLLLGLQSVPSAVLAKELRFRELSVFNGASAVVAAAATLGMAALGLAYWALVLGNLAGALVRGALVLRARPCRLAWPRLNSIRAPLKFGQHVTVSLLAYNSYMTLDNFTAGKVLGESALGLYSAAWNLAYVPLEKVTTLVTNVLPSYLAAFQTQPAALRRYLRSLTETVALLTCPATIGLALVARELVPLVFGHRWGGMIASLQVLAFYTSFRSVVALLPKFLTAVNEVRYVMWNDLAALIILPVAFYIGSYRGIVGIAWAWVIAYPIVVLPLYRKTFQAIGMKAGEYLGALRPPVEGTLAMIVAVELAKRAMTMTMTGTRLLVVRLVVEIAVGALTYVVTLRLRHRERMATFVQTLKGLLKRNT
jgi:teichuronic acid exporter